MVDKGKKRDRRKRRVTVDVRKGSGRYNKQTKLIKPYKEQEEGHDRLWAKETRYINIVLEIFPTSIYA